MSKHNIPRIPLHMQPGFEKAGPQKNPSWESFRAHQIHEPEYKYQGQDRPNTHMMSMIRRYPDGTLDFEWAAHAIIDAIHNLSYPHALRPIDQALLTVVFPDKYQGMMPQEADLKTQFTASEKTKIRHMVEEHFLEEGNWNQGAGGGDTRGRSVTRDGKP